MRNMKSVYEYKCPCCDGAIVFDSNTGKMKCPYCDTEFDIETLRSYDEDLKKSGCDSMKWETPEPSDWADGMRVYSCTACGGEVIGDDTLAAAACPYCGNPVIMMGQFGGVLKPDCIIPFKLDKEAAKAGLRKHLTGKPLLPKVFRNEHHIDEIKGIYVPMWLFDAKADADIRYKATKLRTWSDSNYIYTETSHYSVTRAGNLSFATVPEDGSSKMPDDLMESLEPYDFSEAVDFRTAYLAGFFADKYDVSADERAPRANERIRKTTESAFMGTVRGYSSVRTENSSVRFTNAKVKYALYPAWILNTTWNGNKYLFAMNGQTGKFVGDLPVDKGAAAKWTFGIAAIAAVAAFAVLFIMGMM